MKKLDSTGVLNLISMVCTGLSLFASLMSGMASDKKMEIEMRQEVAKEVQKQLLEMKKVK